MIKEPSKVLREKVWQKKKELLERHKAAGNRGQNRKKIKVRPSAVGSTGGEQISTTQPASDVED